jgi:ligand-binding sensor domain-containing protein
LVLLSWNKSAGQHKIYVSKGDPYFIKSTDTISKYGPDHIVRDVLQDKKGNIWLATWLGIIKYNGKLFTNYTLQEGLIKFHIVCCYEDRRGNLWFGTARGGIYCYDGRSFKLFTAKNGLIDNNVACILEDKAGNIWFGCETGASCYNGKTFTNFSASSGFTSSFVNCMIQDKTGKLLFGTTEGLFIFDGKTFTKKSDLPFEPITGLLEDRKGNLWIGSFNGLVRYDVKSKNYTKLPFDHLAYYMIEDASGNIWFTHSEDNEHYTNIPDQVLYKYDGQSFKKILHKDQPNDFQLFGKTIDKAGNLWFGTMHGICYYDGRSFKYFTKQ